MNTVHSTWLVILMPYNLSPWHCMKQTSLIVALIILGPNSPGNNLDVYLQPFIEELQTLWSNGIQVYDVSKNKNFIM